MKKKNKGTEIFKYIWKLKSITHATNLNGTLRIRLEN